MHKKNFFLLYVCNFRKYYRHILINLLHVKSNFAFKDDPNDKWKMFHDLTYDILSVMCPFKRYRQCESLLLGLQMIFIGILDIETDW